MPSSPCSSLSPLRAFLLLLIALALLLPSTHALSDKAADTRGVPSDLPYIRCETCTHVARAAVSEANAIPFKTITETGLLDVVESLCDPTAAPGSWAKKVDLVERVGHLRLIEQDGVQDCKRECRTLALACRSVLEGVETELAERLYAARRTNTSIEQNSLDQWLCAKRSGISDACRKRAPFLPKDRPKGPPFEPKDEKAVEMEKLMEQMKAMNGGKDLGMNLMSRDDMLKNGDAGKSNDDDDDDDDDDSSKADAGGKPPSDEPPSEDADKEDL